jgi:hypothetical protein
MRPFLIDLNHLFSFLGVMDTYCWIHGTFTIPAKLAGNVGIDMPHPGIGPTTDPNLVSFYYLVIRFRDFRGRKIFVIQITLSRQFINTFFK